MIIQLKGSSPDRYPQVLRRILVENGIYKPVEGRFVTEGYELLSDETDEVINIISNFFAPVTESYQLKLIREQRDKLLSECDWTQMSDSPLTTEKKEEWAIYRQKLRDLPLTCDYMNPIFPDKP